MPTSVVALQILLILLPGFAAAYIVQTLAARGTQTDFDKVIESALYSFLVYLSYSFVSRGTLPFHVVMADAAKGDPTIQWDVARLGWLAGLTLGIALAAVVFINHDGIRLLRKVRLTERTSRRSVWNDIFEGEASRSQIVQVELDGNRGVQGLLTYYSDYAEDCSVFLEQARWVDSNGLTTPINGLGVLLTKSANIKSISLLDPPPKAPADTRPADRDGN